jgi:hypothetical protein
LRQKAADKYGQILGGKRRPRKSAKNGKKRQKTVKVGRKSWQKAGKSGRKRPQKAGKIRRIHDPTSVIVFRENNLTMIGKLKS